MQAPAAPTALTVTDVSPRNAAPAAPTDAVIRATFSAPIDAASVTSRTFTVRGAQTGDYAGAYTTNGNSVTFDPARAFRPGEEMAVNLSSGLRDTSGNALTPYAWSFNAAVLGGTGMFTDSGQRFGSTHDNQVTLGDVDGDGDLDAVIGHNSYSSTAGPITLWLNDGSGNFSNSNQILGNGVLTRLGDLDNDGDLDLFIGSYTHSPSEIWFNDGAGNFTNSGQQLGNHMTPAAQLVDLDSDGDLDLFVGNRQGQANEVWFNDSTGHFSDSGQRLGNADTVRVSIGDLDNDGDLDVFVINVNSGWGEPDEVWFNNGNGYFTDSGQRLDNPYSHSSALGDLDNDGDLDVVTGWWGGRPAKVWLNDGAGVFSDSGQQLLNGSVSSVVFGDLDADSDLDALFSNLDSESGGQATHKVWFNDGQGHFVNDTQTFGVADNTWAALGDLDNDGDLDVIRTNWNQLNEVWFNGGTTPAVISPTAVTLTGPTAGEVGAAYTFEAAVSPVTATTPLTYTWAATDHAPVTRSGGTTDSAAFTWLTPGQKTLTVTARNAAGVVSATHTLAIAPLALSPITLSAESGYRALQLEWTPTNSPAVTGYRLLRRLPDEHTWSVFEPIATVTTTAYFDADPALIPGEYCYQVEALTPAGVAQTSNIACATVGRVDLWIPDVWAAPGDAAIVPVNIRNAQGLHLAATDIWLDFDPAVLTPLVISRTALTADYAWSYAITSTAEFSRARIAALASPPPQLYGDGTLFWLTFRVRGAAGMTSTLNLRDFIAGVGGSTIYAPADLYHPIPLRLQDGVFHVAAAYRLGDLNGNHVIEAIDAYIALQIASAQLAGTWQQRQAGDVNSNGVVDAADASMILYRAAHGRWPVPGSNRQTRARAGAPAVRLTSAAGAPGALVEIALTADALTAWAGGQFVIAYDRATIAGIESAALGDFPAGYALEFHDAGNGLATLALAGETPLTGGGVLAHLQVRLKPNATIGSVTPLALAEARLNDVTGRDFATSALQQAVARGNGQISVTLQRLYLPLILRNMTATVTFAPLAVGAAIPARAAAYQGEIFYSVTLTLPAQLPAAGRFYLSAQPDRVAAIGVDDALVVYQGTREVLTHLFDGAGGGVQAEIVEIPRATLLSLAGQTITIQYRDVYAGQISATAIWLIWTPGYRI